MKMSNGQCPMTNKIQMSKCQMTNNKYDLGERTSKFSEEIIRLCKTLPVNLITTPLITQLIRSATSIGANYCEADNAESRKDFKHKITICNKEAKETKYWLKILIVTVPEFEENIVYLKKEATEFILIFSKIILSTKRNMNSRHLNI
jgi:four helix bundle protein